jgi:phage terminase small subunit
MGTPHFRTAMRDQVFVDAYLQSGEVAVAAKAAFSKAKDLDRAGRELLKRPAVQVQLQRRVAELAKNLQILPEDILLLVGALPRLREMKMVRGVSADGRVLH